MGADTFICGECQTTFHDINAFLKHKSTNCQNEEKVVVCNVGTSENDVQNAEQQEVEEIELANTAGDASQTVLQMVDDSGEHQTVRQFCLFVAYL